MKKSRIWTRLFLNRKLNTKFTAVIVLFVMVPIIVIMTVFEESDKRNLIQDEIIALEYSMEQLETGVATRVDALNMVTQFFLKDEALLEYLELAEAGETLENEFLYRFKNTEVVSLERLVNNNFALYGVRVYGVNDDINEMMPIIYKNARMHRQKWALEGVRSGWYFGYSDAIFSSYSNQNDKNLIAYITPVYGSDNQQIGTLEAVMTMAEMFRHEDRDHVWGFFYGLDGKFEWENGDETDRKIASEIMNRWEQKDSVWSCYEKIDGKHLVYAYWYFPALDSTYVLVKDISEEITRINHVRISYLLLMIVLTLVLAVLINQIVNLLLKKFHRILTSIREVQGGNLAVRFDETGGDEMAELGGQINKMMDRIQELMDESINRQILAKNSEIKALQNQINAHFIYNVLESIKMMAEIEGEYDISDSITALGELLRYGMKKTEGNVAVAQEIEYIRNYIKLMNLRYDFVITLAVNMPDWIYHQEIPKMTLQPIVENAICHGIIESEADAVIYIKAVVQEKDYYIEITDSGLGMEEEQLEKLRQKISGNIEYSGGSGNGIGLKNVQDRIALCFGSEYGLEIMSKAGCYTKVIVKLPITAKEPAAENG